MLFDSAQVKLMRLRLHYLPIWACVAPFKNGFIIRYFL